MAHDVFISHAAGDKTSADMLCATLEQQGVRCWVAPRDVRPGTDWRSAILTAIRESRAMVLIFSERANESRHVNREVDCAIEAGIPVVPFRMQDVPARGPLEYSLYGVHWLDAVTPPIDDHMRRLAALLVAMLAGDARATQTLTGSPRTNTLGLFEPADSKPHVPRPMPDNAPKRRGGLMLGVALAALVAAVALIAYAANRTPPAPAAAELPAPAPAADAAAPLASALRAEPEPAAAAPAAQPATTESAPADGITFASTQAELVWEVEPSRAGDFESFWKKLVEGLLKSTSPDYQAAARSFTLAKTPGANKMFYVVYIDPVVRGMNYLPGYLLTYSASLDEPDVDALLKKLLATGATLATVPLERIQLLPADATMIDQIPVMGMREAKDGYAFSSDHAQIVFHLKPGKRAAFESAWRTVVAGLMRSPNERVRQAAVSIAAFRTDSENAVIFRMDPVVKGVSYDPSQLMFYAGTFARPTLDALAAELWATVESVSTWPLSVIR